MEPPEHPGLGNKLKQKGAPKSPLAGCGFDYARLTGKGWFSSKQMSCVQLVKFLPGAEAFSASAK
ncbi:hypothetical protein D3C86_1956140 [compost metagenome]